ncbi:hypothetical protein P152DRAFT_9300 [Eremomyces bilateralis CBS 781.70]|uniref:Glycosyltransferase 2 n=1 Tax=Eremomyces bilateralis CBS 781.70 TaxID=1392243 RepID=A0A6G1GGS4_9PEZI|nr:uncharacterized protein P152DRAFT_9300 [Eremomyces bilateralis CBS 781.70]KAF1817136.1 hypothetical protein P152DRAFT_9300 [Eremomyces bilateralis CBS 781.70]
MVPSRFFPTDEELGKRDDNRKQPWRRRGSMAGSGPLRYRCRRRRIVPVIFLICALVFYVTRRGGFTEWTVAFGDSSSPYEEPTGRPPVGHDDQVQANIPNKHYYDGPLRFFRLAASLRHIDHPYGGQKHSRHVLFAASSLKSASSLIPMACEMAHWDRNYVHIILLGRNNLSLKDVQEINGVDPATCDVMWHDGRSDFAEYSTEKRAQRSIAAAIMHVNMVLSPRAVIIDDPTEEDAFFVTGIRAKVHELGLSLIEIPRKAAESLRWITRLDSSSLRAWNIPTIDILVHAPTDSSGSLIGMIKSLQATDYKGLPTPRLIIELPANAEPFTLMFLDNLEWPPPSSSPSTSRRPNQLILRRRLPSRHLTPEESSLRFMEGFFPSKPGNHAVFVVSAQTQLSPTFYHYLYFTLLEYRYGQVSSSLMGISLDVPDTHLNGSAPFTQPLSSDIRSKKYHTSKDSPAPFLWQAPNANAALYFGDKWLELQSFLTQRISAFHDGKKTSPRTKIVSPTLPAWTEYFLELMRARGYSMLYPGLLSASHSLVTVHTELSNPPDDFPPANLDLPDPLSDTPNPRGLPRDPPTSSPPDLSEPSEPFLPASFSSTPLHTELPLADSQPLHVLLPWDGDLPELIDLPLLSHAGEETKMSATIDAATAFADTFRVDVGGCDADAAATKRTSGRRGSTADDLFCLDERE